MIVYLQKQYADDDQHESHWLRNSLLTAGALTAGHFAAKGGLMGRHMQKFAGNMHTRIGNALNINEMTVSGRRAAGEAQAKIANNVTGRGNAAWEEAYNKAHQGTSYTDYLKQNNSKIDITGLNEEQIKDKALGMFKGKQIGQSMKSGEGVLQAKDGLAKQSAVRNMMNSEAGRASLGIKEGESYENAVKAFDNSTFGQSWNKKYGGAAVPQQPVAQ